MEKSEEAIRRLRERVEGALPPLEGWTTVEKGVVLAELVYRSRAELSVEIGVFGGRGTIALALGHEAAGTGRVAAVDPWEAAAALEGENAPENDEWWSKIDYEAILGGFRAALARHGLTDRCRIVRARSSDAVREFPDGSVGVLHQDGNHSERVSCADVALWCPKLRPGGYWVADDTDWPTTRRAQEMLSERGFSIVEDHVAWRVYRKPLGT